MKKVGILILTFVLCVVSAQAQYFFPENKNLGKQIPDFTLPAVSGENINLNEFRNGSNVIVFFWATWCPHCRNQLKVLSQQKETILGAGIKIITVDYGEDIDTVKKYAKRNGIDITMVADTQMRYEEAYDLIGVPTFFFVDKEGIVRLVQHDLPENLNAVFNNN